MEDTARFFNGMEEIAHNVLGGEDALKKIPTNFFEMLDLFYQGLSHQDETVDITKREVKICLEYLARSESNSDQYRLAINSLLIKYAGFLSNALEVFIALWPAEKIKANENDFQLSLKQAVVLGIALKASLAKIKFSEEYYSSERSIKFLFNKKVVETGIIEKLYGWEKLSLPERQDLIKQNIAEEFLAAVKDAAEGFESLAQPSIHFMQLLEGLRGVYLKGHVIINMDVINMTSADLAVKTVVHEIGHHKDEFISETCPKGFSKDKELLDGLEDLKKRRTSEVFDRFMYQHMPDEKMAFHDDVCGPILEKLKERRLEDQGLKEVQFHFTNFMINLSRCFPG